MPLLREDIHRRTSLLDRAPGRTGVMGEEEKKGGREGEGEEWDKGEVRRRCQKM